MIATPKEMLTTWYMDWKKDLETNLAKQAELQADEAKLRDLIATCERAFTVLFPEGEGDAPVVDSPVPNP